MIDPSLRHFIKVYRTLSTGYLKRLETAWQAEILTFQRLCLSNSLSLKIIFMEGMNSSFLKVKQVMLKIEGSELNK